MRNYVSWDSVNKQNWSYKWNEKNVGFLIYRLDKLPDFTEPRFEYLCKEKDDRSKEIVKRQMEMIRQFHGLGSDWTISLRLKKENNQIVLYLIFRYTNEEPISEIELQSANNKIKNALMNNEYSFKEVDNYDILELSWAQEAAEIIKYEGEYKGDTYPDPIGGNQEFYVPMTWIPTDNNMQSICSAMMNVEGNAVVEVTIAPSQYLSDEKDWINVNIQRLKDCMNGETFRNQAGRIIWQGKKLPILKNPIDNCEKMNKQYEVSRIFLSSIRVFTDNEVESLANAFLVNCTKREGRIQIYKRGFKHFEYLKECYENVELSVEIHTPYWNQKGEDASFRAQRLNRLNSLEEIANFFRIPIPIKPGFPGFGFDTGIDGGGGKKKARSIIKLGSYLDDNNIKADAVFDSQQLAKHGLIVGVPGSGKTTAMFNILYQLWNQPDEKKIPFIILEPAKTEYRALKTLDIFKEDMLVFTLGDEGVSPFRFNPMEVLPGIKIESHISRLQACFVGAFDLFDPLPIFLEQAIRRTYLEKGWYEDSIGGEEGLETPTLSDLSRNAEYIVAHSGFDSKMRSDFQASLLERLNSLRRGSKGRMLDTPHSIPMEELMSKPIVMELDSLNGDEKSLMMMFLLSYVYEYCKVMRKSGSPLKHMLLVEEAHNLIGSQGGGSDSRADPKAQTIELFVNMLAEMRALGQGILIADQLPTAIAPQAVKQTNVKVLMRVTAKDDREEIGNTMDLNEEQMHQVVNFKTGHAYLYHEGEDRVRTIRMLNFKGEHDVEEPPIDHELKQIMHYYEQGHKWLYMPYSECSQCCELCNRRVRNQAESFVQQMLLDLHSDIYKQAFHNVSEQQVEKFRKAIGTSGILLLLTKREKERIVNRYKHVGKEFGSCVYVHILNKYIQHLTKENNKYLDCKCDFDTFEQYYEKFKEISEGE